MTSCAITGVAAIADRRAAAPNSTDFVTGILLLDIKRHTGSNAPSPRAVYSNGNISSSPPTASLCFTAEEVCLSSYHTHRRVFRAPGCGLARIALHARAIAHKWPHLRPQSVRGEGGATHRPAHCVACCVY